MTTVVAERGLLDALVSDLYLGEYGQFQHDKYNEYKKIRDALMLAVHVEACEDYAREGKFHWCGEDGWLCDIGKQYQEEEKK